MAGLVVGLLSDLVGTLISGYGVYFPPLAITPILNGVLPGLCYRYVFKENMNFIKCIAMVVVTEIISSLLLGTYALTWYYHLFVPNKEGTFVILFIPRLCKIRDDCLRTRCLYGLCIRRLIEAPSRRFDKTRHKYELRRKRSDTFTA
jgi:hypothetical protein